LRCREATRVLDTAENRAQVRRTVRQIDGEIAAGTFDYPSWFPKSRRAALFAAPESNGPPLYCEYAKKWLNDKQARLASGTAYDWRRIVESRLIPTFGDRQVSTLDVEAIEGFIADLKRGEVSTAPAPDTTDLRKKPRAPQKLSNRRVNIILKVLRQSLDRAVTKGWLPDNPARKIDLLREDKPEIDPLSVAEVKAFLSKGLQEEEDRRYFRVAFFSGLRPGEEIGLQWDDIDWQRKMLLVRRSVSRFRRRQWSRSGRSRCSRSSSGRFAGSGPRVRYGAHGCSRTATAGRSTSRICVSVSGGQRFGERSSARARCTRHGTRSPRSCWS
jgi:integrase